MAKKRVSNQQKAKGGKGRLRARVRRERIENARMMTGLDRLAAMTDVEAAEYVRRSKLSGG